MGKVIVKKVRGMKPAAKLALVVLCTLLVSVFMYEGYWKPRNAAAAIAHRGTSAAATSSTNSITISKPTGTVQGDVMIANIAWSTGSTANSNPPALTGWTLLTNADSGSTSTYRRGATLYKVAGSSEPSSYTFTFAGSGTWVVKGAISSFSGVNTSTPVEVTGTHQWNSSSTTITAPGITTQTANAVVLFCAQFGGQATTSGWTTASAGTMTEIYDYGTTNNMGVAAATLTDATPGSTGNGTVTLSTALRNGGVLLALKPASTATTTLGTGANASTGPACPGSRMKLGGFSFVTTSGTDSVTGLTVTTTGQAGIASLEIWDEAETTQYYATVNNPGSDTWTFSGGTAIPVSNTGANFKIVATYDSHTAAPAGNTATTGYVSAYTCTNGKSGTDTAEATITLDNTAATAATWGTNSVSGSTVTLNWTLGTAGDNVMIARYTANTDTTMPTDGTSYSPGSGYGTGGTVVYAGTGTTTTDNPPSAGTFYYRIFEYEGCQNYATTAPWSTGQAVTLPSVTVGALANYPPPATVTQGQTNVPMLKFTLATNTGTATWTGGSLDKIGTNATPANVTFDVYRDANGDGTLDPATDTLIGTATFSAATQTYTLSSAQTITTTAQRYFIAYDIATNATTGTTVGARIASNAYFTVSGGTVNTLTSTSSGTPTINPGVCTRNAPTVSMGSSGMIAPGGQNAYTLMVTNNDTATFCGSSTFTLSIASETGNTASFILPSTLGSTTTGALAAGGTYSTTLTVKAQASAIDGNTLTSTAQAADTTNHSGKTGSGSVVSTIGNKSPLMHNSQNLGTKYGTWGVTGGKYGAFTCETCHTKNTTNIKRVQTTITAPQGQWSTSKTSTLSVVFKNLTGFGRQAELRNTSTRICEVCHSKTTDHSYKTANSTWTHNGNIDCTDCHSHNKAFQGSGDCVTCHSAQKGTSRRQVVSTASIIGDFSGGPGAFTNLSSHVTTNSIVPATCQVCHSMTNHGSATADPSVVLKNADTGADLAYDGTAATGANLETFCTSCHDANGATSLGANAMKPYTESGDNTAPPNISWPATGAAHDAGMTCFLCHGMSQAANTTLDPKYNGHASHNGKILQFGGLAAGDESGFCYNCHGTPVANGAVDDIKTVFAKVGTHNLTASGKDGNDCANCHDKHQAQSGASAIDTGTNVASRKLYGAPAVNTTTWSTTLWGTGATWTNGTLDGGTTYKYEWQICLGCHKASLSANSTALEAEFNPHNTDSATLSSQGSYHPVIQLNPKHTYTTGWQTAWANGNTKTMLCSDCHTDSAAGPKGPHGSATAGILRAAYDNTGTLCKVCHNLSTTGFMSGTSNLHTNKHNSYACKQCHIAIPHGGQKPHLLRWVGMPAIYDGSGTSSALAKGTNTGITTWRAGGSWTQNDCDHTGF